MPLISMGVTDKGKEPRDETFFTATAPPAADPFQVVVNLLPSVGEARRAEELASDETSQAMFGAIGGDLMVLRQGNVVVLYDKTPKPDKLASVREALETLRST